MYIPMCVITNDDSRMMLQVVASLTYDSRGINYDHNMFIVQATRMLVTRVMSYPSLSCLGFDLEAKSRFV